MSEYYSKKIKGFIKGRAKGRCEYCQWFDDFAPSPYNIEHIIPSSKGGLSSLENLAFSCRGCNGHKSNTVKVRHDLSASWIDLYNPRTQIWSEHFAWDMTKTKIIGLTPTGEVTIQTLKMNRAKLTRLRGVFVALGMHPPDD